MLISFMLWKYEKLEFTSFFFFFFGGDDLCTIMGIKQMITTKNNYKERLKFLYETVLQKNFLGKKLPWYDTQSIHSLTVADPRGGGAQQACAPPKIESIMLFNPIFFIRMLKNKAQIARESIKITPELPGPLRRPWTPAESEFGSALVMCVLAHNLLRPPPPPPEMKILDPPLP